jgi:hypothetical protein
LTKRLTIVASPASDADAISLTNLRKHPLVEGVFQCSTTKRPTTTAASGAFEADSLYSSGLIRRIIAGSRSDYLLFILPGEKLHWNVRAFERLIHTASDTAAGLVFSDYRDQENSGLSDHPLIDYQAGSIRDNFDFGGAFLVSRSAAQQAIANADSQLEWGALYDLRLRISESAPIIHLPEYLYTKVKSDLRASGERVFDYVDPSKRAYQLEMEKVATEHLRRIGALITRSSREVSYDDSAYPVALSVVIPVRNRIRTIGDAIRSALAQETTFEFNVIVVDNHSTDGTSDAIREIASSNPRVVHLVPGPTNLGIGGCWNEAVFSSACGRYCMQLDSDDIYSGTDVLARIEAKFRESRYAMVIGSYKTVDFDLNELPPGLVDHREWTPDNGRNNALRINGLGAPRAFDVTVLRDIAFPDVSYGEDYAVALRVSREYQIGRIYEPLYLARRWGGNSDSALPLATMNRYDHYKDWIRTNELRARQRLNQA